MRITPSSGAVRKIDLQGLCGLEALRDLRFWGFSCGSAVVTGLPVHAKAILNSLAGFAAPVPVPPAAEEGAIVPLLPEPLALEMRALRQLSLAGHWAHRGSYTSWFSLDLPWTSVEGLMAAGVLAGREDMFFEFEVALRAEQVTFHIDHTLHPESESVFQLALPDDPVKAHKLGLVVELHRLGWKQVLAPIGRHTCTSPLEYPVAATARSKLYFVALLELPSLIGAGLPFLLSMMPEAYYKCVLNKTIVKILPALTEEELRRMPNADFSLLLKGASLENIRRRALAALEDAPPVLALMDEEDEAGSGDDRSDDLPPLAAPPDDVAAPLAAPALAPADLVGPADALAALAPINVAGYCIKFTTSHSSGCERAYVQCDHPEHRRCYKYRQTNVDPDRRHLLACLVAWARMGAGLARAVHADPMLRPSDAQVEAALADIP